MTDKALKINEPTLDDSIDLLGILSFGGLNPQVQRALVDTIDAAQTKGRIEAPAVQAISGLLMSALANRQSRDEIRGFLFNLWCSPQDEKAEEKDRDEGGHLTGALRDEKLKGWRRLGITDLKNLIQAFVKSRFFKDFLSMFREELTTSSETQTESSATTGLEAVK